MAATHTSGPSPPRRGNTGVTVVRTKISATRPTAYANHLSCWRSFPVAARNRARTAATGIRYTTKAQGDPDTVASRVASGLSIASGFATVSAETPRVPIGSGTGSDCGPSRLPASDRPVTTATSARGRRQRGDGNRPVGYNMIARNRQPSAGSHAYPMSNAAAPNGSVPDARMNAAHPYAPAANES